MPEQLITGAQLKRLQTLWGIFWAWNGTAHGPSVFIGGRIGPKGDRSRGARLGWIAGVVGRQIISAKNLTRSEAIRVLDELAKIVPAQLVTRRRPDRRTAKSYGTAGRKGMKQGKTIDLIDAPTWELIFKLMRDLEWTRARLDAFVVSPHGPKRLVTLADANKVIWAMKQMIRRKKKSADSADSADKNISISKSVKSAKSVDALEEVATT